MMTDAFEAAFDRFLAGQEDAADFLTLEFSRRDGRWLATWGGLEK